MEDPEDSFGSARHLLLEVMAEQEGIASILRHEHDCRSLVRSSLAIQALLSWVQGTAFH
jgi:hypothetical protein